MRESFFILCWMLVFPVSIQAQGVKTKHVGNVVQNFNLKSKLMARDMPYQIIFPSDYQTAQEKRYPIVYLIHHLFGHFNSWTEKTKIVEYAAKYSFIVVTPEGDNGWYTDGGSKNTDKYESYLVQELVPEVDNKFRSKSGRSNRAIVGFSMGGYGAVKFGLKHPQIFSVIGSIAGALNAAEFHDKSVANWLSRSIMPVFGEPGSEVRRLNDIFRIVREMSVEKATQLPYFYFDCGTEDLFIKSNRDFATLLFEKKIPHEFHQLPGKHEIGYADARIKEFLELISKRI